MNFKKLFCCALFGLLMIAGARTVAAQEPNVATAKVSEGIDWNESFEGSSDSSGQVMLLTSSAAVHLGHFSVGAGIPLYFTRSTSTTGSTTSDGVGDFFVTLGAAWKGPILNYGTTLTGTAPTGSTAKGFSTGHATFDWSNRIDHDISILTPFLNAGIGNTVTDSRFFNRPFTSYGYLAHTEVGTDVDLSHSFSLTLSGYDIAPWGTQTIFSRIVPPGALGKGGQHGRVFQTNNLTTGTASVNQDDGFTAGLDFSPKPYLSLDAGYTRSVKFAFNSFSWGVAINLSKLNSGKGNKKSSLRSE
jgi:hypothetical protein